MRENYESAILDKDGAVCDCKRVIPQKVNNEGIPTLTTTIMHGITKGNTEVYKLIEIDDESGRTSETIIARKDKKDYRFQDCNLTRYRCAEMTVLAMKMLYHGTVKRVGFIGNGQINLLNCIAISRAYGVNDVVIRGSKANPAKNVGSFMTVCDSVSVDASDDMHLLNQCDVVVVCTSSCTKENVISSDMLNGPKLIVALDCGYYLGESFRKDRASYCDYPEQLQRHYKSEFPFDGTEHEMLQMRETDAGKAVVYLYGVAIADAVAAERLIERLESDGMEKPFLD